ncbi:MAG: sigma-70 family RNA polymerase sigma factor [Crocinitomicaceae bacterium]|jgi:RNA polymerase sigma-70 factor (ECF subfamily)|nr:sigma-70 family RNA polymerase sigma factor [Crocinitomicaceae bacterium]MBT6515588.1 sigma-70 family RNA polymerase sigma factor [Crocinitomicaceae bacterium]
MALFETKNMVTLSDRDLIYRYQKTRNKRFVGELYKRYSHLVYGVSLKYLKNVPDAQDNVMVVFEKLMSDLESTDVKNFKAWIHTVTKNQCLMKLRKKSRLAGKEQNLETVEYALTSEPKEDVKLKEEQFEQLEAAIEELKPEQRKCVELFFLEQTCYQEIAEKTGFSLKKVKSYIQNGKRNLKIILTNNGLKIQ